MRYRKIILDELNKERSNLRDLTSRKMDKSIRVDLVEDLKTKVEDLKKELEDTDACIDCRYFRPIMKHPANKTIGNGSIIDRMGWVCSPPINESKSYFFESQYGICEMFSKKK